jgi:hypothetical protein
MASLVEEEEIVIREKGDLVPNRISRFLGHSSSLISFFYSLEN